MNRITFKILRGIGIVFLFTFHLTIHSQAITEKSVKKRDPQEAYKRYMDSDDMQKKMVKMKKAAKLLPVIFDSLSKINSIEYRIKQRKTHRHGYNIDAIFIQKKGYDIKDIGFDKAFIKSYGTVNRKPFSFAYNGDFFFHQKDEKVKKYKNPSKGFLVGLLSIPVFNLRVDAFTQSKLFQRKATAVYEGKEIKNGKLCHKFESIIFNYDKEKDKVVPRKRDKIWIDEKTHLPVAISSRTSEAEITIISINKEFPKSFFSIESTDNIKEYNRQDSDEIKGKDYLLKSSTISPEWSGISQKGKKYSLESLKGKVVFIDFWGTWCPPCIKAMPHIEKLYQHYKNNDDVVVIGISANEKDKKAAATYFTKKEYNYVHIPNGDEIAKSFKVVSFPTLYIIDKNGKIVRSTLSSESGDIDWWKKTIDALLK